MIRDRLQRQILRDEMEVKRIGDLEPKGLFRQLLSGMQGKSRLTALWPHVRLRSVRQLMRPVI